jgi:hypothetical protein
MVGDRALPPIQVAYNLADMFGVQFHALGRFVRMFVIVELLWVALIVGVDLVDGVPTSWSIGHLPWKLLGWGALLIVAFWFGLCPFLAYLRVKRAGAGGPNTFALTDQGIRLQTPRSESVVYWNAVRRTVSNSQRLYLFFSSPGAIIVPRRSFASDDDFAKWIDELERHLKADRSS